MAADIIVRFKPMGHEAIIDAIKRLEKAQKGASETTKESTKKTKENEKATGRNRKAMSLFEQSMSTVRSRLLVFNFAMAMGTKQLIEFAKAAAKIQDMERAFINLSGGGVKATDAINKLRKATNGTLSDFDLFQQANNAMILGVTKNSDEMAEMFDMAQRLGDALGKDVKLSIESLVTGIGRQSRLMLDNIGIIVKADKAYEDYAAEVGKTADTLTDYEKRQAFTNATLEAAREKLKGLPHEVISSNKVFQQFSASMSNASVAIGNAFLPMMESLAKAMTTFADAITPSRVKAFSVVVSTALVGAMIKYRKELQKVIVLQAKTGWGLLAVGVGILATELLSLSGILGTFDGKMENVNESTKSYLERLKDMTTSQLKEELNKQAESIEEVTESTNDLQATFKSFDVDQVGLAEHLGLTKEIVEAVGGSFNFSSAEAKNNTKEIQNMIDTIEGSFSTYNSFLNAQDQINKMYSQTREAQLATINTNIATTQSLLDIAIASDDSAEAQKKYVDILAMLNQKKLAMLHAEEQAQLKSYSRAVKGAATVAEALGAGAKEVALIQAAGAMVDAFAGASSARFNAQKAGLLPPIPGIMYGIELAAGIANARAVAMSANKIGSGSAPKFAEGGYVGGRPHSQGGTIIEAERGEFVMSRNAVESIGLETLNQMNQQGGGTGINVTVTGNVLTQDFVEGELAESIKEAVRRGSDFGLS